MPHVHHRPSRTATAKVGEGGMGCVCLSRTRRNQPVALKVIRREFAREQDFRVRFEREVQAARRVQGCHIVPVLGHDTGGQQPWLATAFFPGPALDDALAAHGPLPLPAVFQLIGCTARALRFIDAASVVHRGLKPSNILLGSDGRLPAPLTAQIARREESAQAQARAPAPVPTPAQAPPPPAPPPPHWRRRHHRGQPRHGQDRQYRRPDRHPVQGPGLPHRSDAPEAVADGGR
ncbi:protein kinase [Streptomyces sp. NPDC057686]|uniref:protein kinase domain-containing protein n=1 Tax=Streptomyces sp. NPDC057686 TaxID=3346212 RepID=UPI0036CB26CA